MAASSKDGILSSHSKPVQILYSKSQHFKNSNDDHNIMTNSTNGNRNRSSPNFSRSSPTIENSPHFATGKVINILQTRKSVFRRSISPSRRKENVEQSSQNRNTILNKSPFNRKLNSEGFKNICNSNLQNLNLSPIKKTKSIKIPDVRSVTTETTLKSWVKDMPIFQCGSSRQNIFTKENLEQKKQDQHDECKSFVDKQRKYEKQIENQKSDMRSRKVDHLNMSNSNVLITSNESYSSIDSPPLSILKRRKNLAVNNQRMVIQSNNDEQRKLNKNKYLITPLSRSLNTSPSSSNRRSPSPPSLRMQNKKISQQQQQQNQTFSHERQTHSTKLHVINHPLYDPIVTKTTPSKTYNFQVKKSPKSDDHTSTTEDETLSSQDLSYSICKSSPISEKNQRSISAPRDLLFLGSRSPKSYELLNDANPSKLSTNKNSSNNIKSTNRNILMQQNHETNFVRERIETFEGTKSSQNSHLKQEQKSSLRPPSIVRDRVEMFDSHSRRSYFNITNSHSKIHTKNNFCHDDNRSQISHDTSSIVSDAVKELEQRSMRLSNKQFPFFDHSMKQQRNSSVSPLTQRKNQYLFQPMNRASNSNSSLYKLKSSSQSIPERSQSASSAIKASNFQTLLGNNLNTSQKSQRSKKLSPSPPRRLWNVNLSPLMTGRNKYSNISDEKNTTFRNGTFEKKDDGILISQKKENEKNDTKNLIFDNESVYTNNSEYIPVVIPSEKFLSKNSLTSKNNKCQDEQRNFAQNRYLTEAKNKNECIHKADQTIMQDPGIFNKIKSCPNIDDKIHKQSTSNVDLKCNNAPNNSTHLNRESGPTSNHDNLTDAVPSQFMLSCHSEGNSEPSSTTISSFDDQNCAVVGDKLLKGKGKSNTDKNQALSTKSLNGKKFTKSLVNNTSNTDNRNIKEQSPQSNIKVDSKESETKSKINSLYNDNKINDGMNSNAKISLASSSLKSQMKKIAMDTTQMTRNNLDAKGNLASNNSASMNYEPELKSTIVSNHNDSPKDQVSSYPMEACVIHSTEPNLTFGNSASNDKPNQEKRKSNVETISATLSFKSGNEKNIGKSFSNNIYDTKAIDVKENSTSNVIDYQSKVDTTCNVNVKSKIISQSSESPHVAVTKQEKSNENLGNKSDNEQVIRFPRQYIGPAIVEKQSTNVLNSFQKRSLPPKGKVIENNELTTDSIITDDPNIPLQVVVARSKSNNSGVKESGQALNSTNHTKKSAVKRTIELMNKRRLRLQRKQCDKSFYHKCDIACDDNTTLSSITNPLYGDGTMCCVCGHNVNSPSSLNTIQFLSLLEKPELGDDVHLLSILNNLGEMQARTELINGLCMEETSPDVTNKIESIISSFESKSKARGGDTKSTAIEREVKQKIPNDKPEPLCTNSLLNSTQTSKNEEQEANAKVSNNFTSKVSNLNHSQERFCGNNWVSPKNLSSGFDKKLSETPKKQSLVFNKIIEVENSKQVQDNHVYHAGSKDPIKRLALKRIDNVVDAYSSQVKDNRSMNDKHILTKSINDIQEGTFDTKSKSNIEYKQVPLGQNKKLSKSFDGSGEGLHLDNSFKEQINDPLWLNTKMTNKRDVLHKKNIDIAKPTINIQRKRILFESEIHENDKSEMNTAHTNIPTNQNENDLEKSITITNPIRSKSETSAARCKQMPTDDDFESHDQVDDMKESSFVEIRISPSKQSLQAQKEQKVLSDTLGMESASSTYQNVINGLTNCFADECSKYLENGIQNVVSNFEQIWSTNQESHILDEKKGDQLRMMAMKMRQKQRMLEKDENAITQSSVKLKDQTPPVISDTPPLKRIAQKKKVNGVRLQIKEEPKLISSRVENKLEEHYFPPKETDIERKMSKDEKPISILKQRLSSSPKRLRNFLSRLPQYQKKGCKKQNLAKTKKVKRPEGILRRADKSSQEHKSLHSKKNVKWKSGNELEDVTIFTSDKTFDDRYTDLSYEDMYHLSHFEKEIDENPDLDDRFLLEGNLATSES